MRLRAQNVLLMMSAASGMLQVVFDEGLVQSKHYSPWQRNTLFVWQEDNEGISGDFTEYNCVSINYQIKCNNKYKLHKMETLQFRKSSSFRSNFFTHQWVSFSEILAFLYFAKLHCKPFFLHNTGHMICSWTVLACKNANKKTGCNWMTAPFRGVAEKRKYLMF